MLKPCPFCGGESEMWRISGGGRKVMCNQCDDYHTTEEKAIEAWNNRSAETELLEALREVTNALAMCHPMNQEEPCIIYETFQKACDVIRKHKGSE